MRRAKISLVFVVLATVLVAALFAACTLYDGVFRNYTENETHNSWSAEYDYFDGYRQKTVSVDGDGDYKFTISIVNTSGTFEISIVSGGSSVYKQSNITTSTFTVELDNAGDYNIRLTGEEHSGSFSITW